jgi:AraC family transcriptional regulator
MQRQVTRESYAERIDRVIAHIGADLDRRHSLEDLAEIACFSPFHFHRVYFGVTGETLDDTVRRLRLHRAAVDLNSTALPIGRIATRAGYASVAAFTRAFKTAFARTPAAYRKLRCGDLIQAPSSPGDTSMYDITIASTEGLRLVGFDHVGDYNAIGTTFDRLSALAAAKNLFRPDTRMLGVYYDSPNDVPAHKLRSFAGLTAPQGFEPDSGLRIEIVKAGAIATLTHKGPYAELHQAYDYLFSNWLPTSGHEPDDRAPFEEYLNNPREYPPSEWLTRVCIPLKGA